MQGSFGVASDSTGESQLQLPYAPTNAPGLAMAKELGDRIHAERRPPRVRGSKLGCLGVPGNNL